MPDGVDRYCKTCKRNRFNRIMLNPIEREKHNSRQRLWRNVNSDYINIKRRLQYHANWHHNRKINSLWEDKNREKIRVNKQARRHGRTGINFNVYQWLGLCRLYSFRCICCGEKKKLTPDHVVPISRNGSNSIDNIQPMCLSCNCKKGNKVVDYRCRERIEEMKRVHG